MSKSIAIRLVISTLLICLFSLRVNAQGDNSINPLVNLALVDGAVVTGSIPNDQARGIPDDILWDPSTKDWATTSTYHEYGMVYDSIAYKTKEDPLWWQVLWETEKNVNYITCSGVYPNQPQPTTGWAVQIMVDSIWQDLPKAHNGWTADTLQGAGYGKPTQTNWVWDGQLVWRGLEPVVTKGIRFTAYANPDSLADGRESFTDSLWSFAWSGRDFGQVTPKAALIQYLDFSQEAANNILDPMINLALLDEAIVSANFQRYDSVFFGEWIRNQPADLLYDPEKDDYHNKNTSWGEFGYPWMYDAGFPKEPDDGFQYIVEWPVPKKINYFTWGGCYAGQPQDDTPWAFQYWDGEEWQTIIDGVGGAGGDISGDYDTPWPYTPGISSNARSIWMVPEEEAITTTKVRLAAWSNGFTSLFSFHIRCRGGACVNVDDSENPFKAVLVQYATISDPTAIGSEDLLQPDEFALHQNYPNPFNPSTTIIFDIAKAGNVRLEVFNLLGEKVASLIHDELSAGQHNVNFNAANLASGIYFYKLICDYNIAVKKMMLLK